MVRFQAEGARMIPRSLEAPNDQPISISDCDSFMQTNPRVVETVAHSDTAPRNIVADDFSRPLLDDV